MTKLNILTFLGVTILVIVLQIILLAPHLNYGFADVDWIFIAQYKSLPSFLKSPLSFVTQIIHGNVYTYQIYYIGLQQQIFGLNYHLYQITTHVFKILASLALFPLIFLLTKNKIIAVLTTIIFAVSYSSAGAMYTIVTSGLYLAIIVVSLFLLYYRWLIISKKINLIYLLILAVFYVFVLFLAPERLYPLVPIIIFFELIYLWNKNSSKKEELSQALIRLFFLNAPIILVIFFKPRLVGEFFPNTIVIFKKIAEGNWHLFLNPLAVLGSIVIPREYNNLFGNIRTDTITLFTNFLVGGPLIIFGFVSMLLAFTISRRPIIFLIKLFIIDICLSFLIYIISIHYLTIQKDFQMRVDQNLTLVPALVGAYILSLSITFLTDWIEQKRENIFLLLLFITPVFSFVYIFLTWLAADPTLVFTGVHRYLVIPTIGLSLFISIILYLIYSKLAKMRFMRNLAWLTFLIIIPIILYSNAILSRYFNDELYKAGTDSEEQMRMKNKLWSYLNSYDRHMPALFYFDEFSDYNNSLFNESTILGSFPIWMMLWNNPEGRYNSEINFIRTNSFCQNQPQNCQDLLINLKTKKDGEKGVLYKNVFYKSTNIFAFRFVNKDIVNLSPEILSKINLD